jgi:hypothetical protein
MKNSKTIFAKYFCKNFLLLNLITYKTQWAAVRSQVEERRVAPQTYALSIKTRLKQFISPLEAGYPPTTFFRISDTLNFPASSEIINL